MDELKEQLRAAVAAAGNVQIVEEVPGWGSVTASAASVRTLKGTEDVLQLEGWLGLDDGERNKLKALGVVKTERVYSSARKSAVSVKLAITPLAVAQPDQPSLFN